MLLLKPFKQFKGIISVKTNTERDSKLAINDDETNSKATTTGDDVPIPEIVKDETKSAITPLATNTEVTNDVTSGNTYNDAGLDNLNFTGNSGTTIPDNETTNPKKTVNNEILSEKVGSGAESIDATTSSSNANNQNPSDVIDEMESKIRPSATNILDTTIGVTKHAANDVNSVATTANKENSNVNNHNEITLPGLKTESTATAATLSLDGSSKSDEDGNASANSGKIAASVSLPKQPNNNNPVAPNTDKSPVSSEQTTNKNKTVTSNNNLDGKDKKDIGTSDGSQSESLASEDNQVSAVSEDSSDVNDIDNSLPSADGKLSDKGADSSISEKDPTVNSSIDKDSGKMATSSTSNGAVNGDGADAVSPNGETSGENSS